jgi:hypothetical protein
MMKKSEILVVEDGTLAVFPVTFEEHKEELQSDIKAEVVPMKLLVLSLNYSFLLSYVHWKVLSGSNIVAIENHNFLSDYKFKFFLGDSINLVLQEIWLAITSQISKDPQIIL